MSLWSSLGNVVPTILTSSVVQTVLPNYWSVMYTWKLGQPPIEIVSPDPEGQAEAEAKAKAEAKRVV